MATPSDAARTGTNITTAATSHTINVNSPSAGDLLIVYARFAGAAGTVTFTGYTQLATDSSDASDDDNYIFYRWADGTEGATDPMSTANSIKLATICWRITGACNPAIQAPFMSAVAIGTAANINPTAAPTSGQGTRDYLYLTVIGLDSETATATQPTGYTNLASANSGTGGAVATNCMIWGASKGTTASTSDDPAAWTSSAPNAGVTAWTIAIPPPIYVKTGLGKEGA